MALLAPLPKFQFLTNAGAILAGGKLFTYAAGTTNKQATFTDSTGNTPNTNPIILDANGRCDCWLTPSIAYKFVLSPSTDTDPPGNALWTVDNIVPQQPTGPWAVAAGTSDVITAAYVPVNTSLTDGLLLGFRSLFANATATPTFAPDALPAHMITRQGGAALQIGDIPGALAECLVRYNLANTRWELLNPAIALQIGGAQALVDGANIAWNMAAGEMATVTLGGNRTMSAPTNIKAGGRYAVVVTQDATGGRTLAWNAVFKGVAGQAIPQPLSAVAAATLYTYSSPDGVNLYLEGQAVPAGVMLDYAGGAVPAGYYLCDGAAKNRVTDGVLFAAIGTTWGVGDGATTFNLPDSRRRVPVGSGGAGTGTLGNAVGNTGGEETHQLTIAELASHSHVQQIDTGGSGFGGSNQFNATPAATGYSTLTAGSDTPHNNIQPSYVVTRIIKM